MLCSIIRSNPDAICTFCNNDNTAKKIHTDKSPCNKPIGSPSILSNLLMTGNLASISSVTNNNFESANNTR